MDITPEYRIKDYVLAHRTLVEGKLVRSLTFPFILWDGGKYLGVKTVEGKVVHDPLFAFLIDLIRWGYENMHDYTSLAGPLETLPEVPRVANLPESVQAQVQHSREPEEFFEPFMTKVKKSGRTLYKKDPNRLHLPTLSTTVRGFHSVSGDPPGTGWDAVFLAAIEMGFISKHYDGIISNFHVDDTTARLEFLREEWQKSEPPSVVNDTGWAVDLKTSITRRGITDYERTVEFSAQPSTVQRQVYVEMLSLDKCPGYTGISFQEVSSTTYKFRTTWDSSD